MEQEHGMPVVSLESGIRVGNFSSSHSFKFQDGTTLPGCSPERVRTLMLRAIERENPGPRPGLVDISLRFEMSDAVSDSLDVAAAVANVDIVIVPLPVMTALKAQGRSIGKFRTCRVVDRQNKTVSTTRFCV